MADVGQGTVKRIIDRFGETGLSLSDLKQMEPDKVGQLLSTEKHQKEGSPAGLSEDIFVNRN